MATVKKKRTKKKKERVEANGLAHIKASFNNTKITITDNYGNVISWATGGRMGFKGSRKNTSFASQLAASSAGKAAMELGLSKVAIRVKGPGAGRESAIRGLAAAGLSVISIQDVTPIPHNGCRPRKRRRV
ncbi:30S ribosomal protein S11 [bacterium]|nr:30S ribosomal protein S11 [bacterium]MBU1936607.1 30S ribosomal protein S11 [bacterium]